MKLFDVSQIDNQLLIKKRLFPQGIGMVFMIGFVLMMGWLAWCNQYFFFHPDLLSWIPPINKLPDFAKRVIFWALIFMVIMLLVGVTRKAFIDFIDAWRGNAWIFDGQVKMVKYLGRKVALFSEIKCVCVEENTRSEGRQFKLLIKTTSNKEITIASASFGVTAMMDVAQQIKTFTGIEFEHQKL